MKVRFIFGELGQSENTTEIIDFDDEEYNENDIPDLYETWLNETILDRTGWEVLKD